MILTRCVMVQEQLIMSGAKRFAGKTKPSSPIGDFLLRSWEHFYRATVDVRIAHRWPIRPTVTPAVCLPRQSGSKPTGVSYRGYNDQRHRQTHRAQSRLRRLGAEFRR